MPKAKKTTKKKPHPPRSAAPKVTKKREPRCSICTSVKRDAIDLDMVHGVANREVARRHGLSERAVRRHTEHIREWLVQVAMRQEELGYREGMTLIEYWEGIWKKLVTSELRARGPMEKQRWMLMAMQWVDRGFKWGVIDKVRQRLLEGASTIPQSLQQHAERVINLNQERSVRLIRGGAA